MENWILPVGVFVVVYIAISFELMHKAVAALLGVMVLLILRISNVHSVAGYIDFETIMLLMGMMAIVAMLKKSGFFTLLSVKIARLTEGNPLKILILFSIVTAFISAFLDNVTTVLIMTPIIVELTRGMGLDPKLYVIIQAMASNIGGTTTLIGDPPNIIIGSKVGLTFNQFILNLTIPCLIAFCGMMLYCWAVNRQKFKPIHDDLTKLFSVELLIKKIEFDFSSVKIDKTFLTKTVVCFLIALVLFVTQTITKITPGVVAITIAMILFIISKMDVEEMLMEIEWSTLLFFTGLFILVGILEAKGG